MVQKSAINFSRADTENRRAGLPLPCFGGGDVLQYSVCLSLSVPPSVCSSLCLLVCLSLFPSTYLSVCFSLCLCIPVCLVFVICFLFVALYVVFVCLSVFPSLWSLFDTVLLNNEVIRQTQRWKTYTKRIKKKIRFYFTVLRKVRIKGLQSVQRTWWQLPGYFPSLVTVAKSWYTVTFIHTQHPYQLSVGRTREKYMRW